MLVLYARWCTCAVSEFLLKIIQRLGRKPCYPHASCYYCIAAHKVIHTDFYCIAEARFSRRNPSSLLLCVTIRLVLQNDTYSPFYFSFYGELQYYQASQHAHTCPKETPKGGQKKQHQQHQSRFVSKAFPFHALPQMVGNLMFLSAREKHARSCEMRLDWEQQRRREKKIHEHDKRSEKHHR